MSWELFSGTGTPRRPEPTRERPEPKAYDRLPEMPPWRRAHRGDPPPYAMPDELRNAVNAALHLRRPLLLTGATGTGKSTLMAVLARELDLEPVLPWHITSKSVLGDGLFSYDSLDRLQDSDPGSARKPPVDHYITLGPLGTALASRHPRAVLIDEIDKSDLDLPGDLLNVLETGTFEIPQLVRARRLRDPGLPAPPPFRVRGYDGQEYDVGDGKVTVAPENFPVIVFTSNEERAFAPPFLRRCIRYKFKEPTEKTLIEIVSKHLAGEERLQAGAIADFAERLGRSDRLAVTQLLDLVHLVAGGRPEPIPEEELRKILFKPLTET